MSTLPRRPLLTAASVACLLTLTACATAPAGTPVPSSTAVASDQLLETARPAPPEGRVIATGTVLETGGAVQLCLGPIMESYPPQCHGLPIDGWTWDGVDGAETAADTTWGAYAVYGTYDGETYAITDPPIMLALYDPIRPEDPSGGIDGTTSEAELTRIQDDISARLSAEALTVWTERGYVWVEVVWDDGSIQDAADAEYGAGIVLVTSALREID